MKKYIYSIAILFVGMALVTSCSPKVDDVFDTPASERVEEFKGNIKEVLTSAPNGWRMEYYASTTYGGYNVFCSFSDNEVEFASEKVGSTHEAGMGEDGKLIRAKSSYSHYKLLQSQGVVLSFDTHNEIFHYFSEPKNEDFGDTGEGMAGDFEFRVKSACADSVILVGKKHNSTVRMYPVPAEKTWEDVYNEIKATESFMLSRSYSLWKGDEDLNIGVTLSYRRLVFNYIDEEGQKTTSAAAFIVTPDGYKMYRPVTILGQEIAGVEKGEDGLIFNLTNDKNVYLLAYIYPLAEQLQTGYWFIDYNDLGPVAQPVWTAMHTKLEKAGTNKSKCTVYYALLGTYNNKQGFTMITSSDDVIIGMNFNQTDEEGDQVKISINTAANNKSGTTFYKSYGLREALAPFIGTSSKGKIFNLSTDSKRKPSYIRLEEVDDPTNVITLWADAVYYPYHDENEE